MRKHLPRVHRVRNFLYSLLIIIAFLSIFYSAIILLGVDPTLLLGKIKGMLLRRSLYFLFSRLGWSTGSRIILGFCDFLDLEMNMEASGSSGGSGGGSTVGGSSRGAGWTSFDISVLAETLPNEEGEEVAQPHPQNAPTNPVASRGEEVGPSNWVPPEEKFPYHPDEVIGGDSVSSIERRLLAKVNSPSAENIYFENIKAKDLFEIKVEIIRHMAGLDPEGDWLGRGARALDNPRTATGEPSLEGLYALLEDLNRGGVQSETFASLKNKVLSKGEEVRDDNSMS